MVQSRKCSHCGAPLSASADAALRCNFCGTTNQPAHALPPSQAKVLVWVGLAALLTLGLVAVLVGARRPEPPPPRVVVPVPAPRPAPAPIVPPVRPPPPPIPWGPLHAVAVDERGDVLAVLGKALVKVDRATFTARWHTPFNRGHGNYALVVPRGNYVAVVTDGMAAFFASDSGAKINEFKYRNGGILQRACAAGATQVLVDVLGEPVQRFDAATGLRAPSGPGCALRDKLGCPQTQRCAWDSFSSASHRCSYALRAGKEVFRECSTEDGQQRKVLLARGTNSWEVPATESVATWFGVVDETLLVGGSGGVVALNPATGDERWRRSTERSALTADGATVFFGVEGTLVAASARSGEVLQRLPLRPAETSTR